jgi:hypothetical protein
VVDDAMVERFCANMYGWWGDGDTKSRDRALKHVHIALTAALAVQPGSGWRPIETAPKDGTHILLRVKPFKFEGGEFTGDVTQTGYWDSVDGAWCTTTSAWTGPFVKPYAWQPLPAPPAEGK